MSGSGLHNQSEINFSAELLQSILDSAVSAIITIDKSGIIESFNKSAENIFRYSAAEVIGENVKILIPAPHFALHDNYIRNYLETGTKKIIGIGGRELYGKRKDGSVFPMELAVSETKVGEKHVFAGIITDITKRKIAESEVKNTLSLISATLESTADGILVVDSDGQIVKINKQFAGMWGLPEKYSLEWNDDAIPLILKQLKNPDQIESFLNTGHTNIPDDLSDLETHDGRFIERYHNPQIIEERIVGRVYSYRDVTERKIAEKRIQRYIEELQESRDILEKNSYELKKLNLDLEISKQRLKELNMNKDKFFSIISHDLKAPFTSLLGYTEIIIEDFQNFTPEEIKKDIISVHKVSKNIYNLLENLLEWARIQTGRMGFDPIDFNLKALAGSVVNLLEDFAKQKDISLINEIVAEQYVYADENMINTVLRNLCSNAVKFSHPGDVVKIFAEFKDEKIEVGVSDQGIGMTPEDINKLFRIDVHVTTIGTNKEKGTGLGLILCKELVEKNGGRIGVESQPGKGTTIRFTLPVSLKR